MCDVLLIALEGWGSPLRWGWRGGPPPLTPSSERVCICLFVFVHGS